MNGGPIRQQDETYFSALYEAAELAEVTGAYMHFGKDSLSRLTKAVKACGSYPTDTSSEGRNLSFELSVALRAKMAGYSVELPVDGDVSLDTQQFRFLIECKRPQSLSGLKRNLEKAARQSAKRVTSIRDRSVVLVDATVALNPTFKVRRSNLPRNSLYGRAHKFLRAFTQRDGLRVNGMRDLNHIGVLARYSSFGIASGEMFHCQTWAAFPNTRITDSMSDHPLKHLVALLDPNFTQSSDKLLML
jgi:hypothetical protein